MKKTLLFLLLSMPVMSFSQIINTVAGNGSGGFSGDGIAATTSRLNNPTTVAIDAAGNMYIADYGNARVRKVNTSGVISTIAGTGVPGYNGDGILATSAQLVNPAGVAVDAAGNVYISEQYGHRIRKVNTSGIISTIAGNGIAGGTGDGGPATAALVNACTNLAIDATGNIYVADWGGGVVRKISSSGIITNVAGTGFPGFSGDGPATANTVWGPYGLALDGTGNLYIGDQLNERIRKVDLTTGMMTTVGGNGGGGFSGDGGPATAAQIAHPCGVAFRSGQLYIAEYGDHRIRKIDLTTGIVNTIVGNGIAGYAGDGGPATSSAVSLNRCAGVTFDGVGNMYIADFSNHRIRMTTSIASINHVPTFTGGVSDTLEYCQSEFPMLISSMLSISDTDMGQTEIWSLETAPLHGIANVAYTAVSTGGIITPVGLTYSAASGYSGTDMFRVKIKDGVDSSIITINVIVNPMPNAGSISGADSVCPGATVSLTETATGGFWSETNALIATVSGGGVVTGIAPGTDTIVYTVFNSCGVSSVIFTMHVRSYAACHTGIGTLSNGINRIDIYPNPASAELNVVSTEMINSVSITTVTGQTVIIRACATDHEVVDISGLASGVYLIKINGSEVRKFVKQ